MMSGPSPASIAMLVIWLISLGMLLYGTYLAWKHSKSSPPHLDAPFGLIPVSILKPLKGVDPGLTQNLESFFKLDYPCYELIFSVADPMDPALSVVQSLMDAYPEVSTRVFIGNPQVGINPKVNSLSMSYHQAKHDWLLISDSNVRVQSNYLKRLVGHIDTHVGMVTSIVSGTGAEGIGGKLEATFLNTFYARGMHLSWWANKPAVVGKSMLFQRSQADRFGGIKRLGNFLAEDYVAGDLMRKLGRKVILATDAIPQVIGEHSIRDFWSRHLRWGRIRKAQSPITFAFEPWFGCMASGILGARALGALFSLHFSSVLALHLTLWAMCDLLVMKTIKVGPRYWMPPYWFVRELLAVPLWLATACGNTVHWRGKKLVILPGGLLKSVPDKS